MKKLLAILLAGIMVFSMVACSEDETETTNANNADFVGEWKVVSAEMDGEKAPDGIFDEAKIVINNDGTVDIVDGDDKETGTWTADGNKITLLSDDDDEDKIVMEMKDDQLIREEDGLIMILERK